MRLKPHPPLPTPRFLPWIFLGFMTLLLLLTMYLRMAYLTELPPGMHPDIGYYLSDALRISRTFPDGLFLDDRPEPFWRFYLAVWIQGLGAPSFTPTFAGMTIGLFTVAMTYRAALELLRLWRWIHPHERYLAAYLAAGTIAANMVLMFLNREGYRASLVPLSIAFLVFAWARAWRLRRGWWLAGLAAGLPVNTYISGLMAPLASVGTLLMVMVLGRPALRPKPRSVAILLFWMSLALSPQAVLFLNNQDAYTRIEEIDAQQGTPETTERIHDLWSDLVTSIQAFFTTGNYRPNYNVPDTAFLNPALTVLALTGMIVLALNMGTLPTLLTFILLGAMILPGMLSDEPNHPFRLVGTFVPLALWVAAGCGGLAWLLRQATWRWHGLALILRRIFMIIILGIMFVSVGFTGLHYVQHFEDARYLPDEYGWLSFAHYYSITWNDFLAELQQIDQPVYVPVPRLDTALSAWHLRASAFPDVKTLKTLDFDASRLPVGDIWYPTLAEYSYPLYPLNPLPEQFALLLPGADGQMGSITLLPPMQENTSQKLYERVQNEGEPIYASNNWLMGWRLSGVSPTMLTQPPVEWHPSGAKFAQGALELMGYEAAHTLTPGTQWRVTLYWRVLRPIKYDIFNTITLLDTQLAAVETQNHWLYRWIYPAVFWEVGSVIPQVVTFTLPEAMPSAAYSLGISLYTEPNHLQVEGVDAAGNPLADNWLRHQNHRVPLAPAVTAEEAAPLDVIFGDSLRLYAAALTPLQPGQTATLDLYWEVLQRPRENYVQLLHIWDANGHYTVQDSLPFDGDYPTNIWYPGDKLKTSYGLSLPADSQAPYKVVMGWYSSANLERLPALQKSERLTDNLLIMPEEAFAVP